MRHCTYRILSSAVFGLLITSSHGARAQDAQALFDEGLEDMKAGRYKIGCALIRQSLDVDPRPGTLFTLAECYAKAGKIASAVQHYDLFLATYQSMTAAQQKQQAERAEVSKAERARLSSQLSWLTVRLPADAQSGATVTLDGEAFSHLGAPEAVDPGAHQLVAQTASGMVSERRFEIAAGERQEVFVQFAQALVPGEKPGSDGDAMDDTGAEPEKGGSNLKPWIYVTGAIGAAGLLTGAVTGVMLLDKRSVIQKECDSSQHNASGQILCTQKGKDAADLAKGTLAPMTEIALGVGGAGVATALVLLLLDGSSDKDSASRVKPLFAFGAAGATVGAAGSF